MAKQAKHTAGRTNPDHKFRVGISGNCSCGWSGASWFGKGARTAALYDWRSHRESCERAGAI